MSQNTLVIQASRRRRLLGVAAFMSMSLLAMMTGTIIRRLARDVALPDLRYWSGTLIIWPLVAVVTYLVLPVREIVVRDGQLTFRGKPGATRTYAIDQIVGAKASDRFWPTMTLKLERGRTAVHSLMMFQRSDRSRLMKVMEQVMKESQNEREIVR